MLKIVTVVGARPQFIKAAAVSYSIDARNSRGERCIEETLLHTGQHYDYALSEVFFSELSLAKPVHNLNVGSGTHAEQTGAIMRGLEPFLIERKPDLLLIYGDTNSTLAGALVAAKLNIPIAHVEAGLRSRNMRMPEEINRIVADKLSTLLFVGSEVARQNLVTEGLTEKIIDVGDVMVDAIRLFGEVAGDIATRLAPFGLTPDSYALATIHRAENTDDETRLTGILDGLRAVSSTLPIALPLHPRTAAVLDRLGNQAAAELLIMPPVSYLDMLVLERGARLILTDSGGVQKEAYCQGVPCVTLRGETEWAETVASGWNRLAEPRPQAILAAATVMLAFDRDQPRQAFYGDGYAADRIVDGLLRWHQGDAH